MWPWYKDGYFWGMIACAAFIIIIIVIAEISK